MGTKIYSENYCNHFHEIMLFAPVRRLNTKVLKDRKASETLVGCGYHGATVILSAEDAKYAIHENPDLFSDANSRGTIAGWKATTNFLVVDGAFSVYESYAKVLHTFEWKNLPVIDGDRSTAYELECVEIAKKRYPNAVKVERTGQRRTRNKGYYPDITVTFADGSQILIECKGVDSVLSTRSARTKHGRDEEE